MVTCPSSDWRDSTLRTNFTLHTINKFYLIQSFWMVSSGQRAHPCCNPISSTVDFVNKPLWCTPETAAQQQVQLFLWLFLERPMANGSVLSCSSLQIKMQHTEAGYTTWQLTATHLEYDLRKEGQGLQESSSPARSGALAKVTYIPVYPL